MRRSEARRDARCEMRCCGRCGVVVGSIFADAARRAAGAGRTSRCFVEGIYLT